MKKLTKSDISELEYAAKQVANEWIGKLTGGGTDIAYFEGGHKLVRNDDVDCYPTARYVSTADPETILALIRRVRDLEKLLIDSMTENDQLIGLYDQQLTKPRPKRKEFEDIELKDEDMW